MGATKRLCIYRYHSLTRLADPLHPLKKTRFKLFGIKVRKDTPKGIVRRNPVRQVEQFREPGFLRLPEFFDFYPSFCPTDHSANGQNDDIPQAMPFGSFHTRICHLRKDGFQVSEIFFFHLTVSRFLDLILSPPQYLDAIALRANNLARASLARLPYRLLASVAIGITAGISDSRINPLKSATSVSMISCSR